VTIDESHPEVSSIPALDEVARSRAATLELDPIDPVSDGLADYSGPLLSDLDFSAFSHSALVRIADEVCLQMHLLNLGFLIALRARTGDDEEQLRTIATKQLVGIAGVAARRIHRTLGSPGGVEGAVRVLGLHPLLNPAAYVNASVGDDGLTVRRSVAVEDGAWVALCGPKEPRPLQAVVRAVDPHLDVEIAGNDVGWSLAVVRRDHPASEFEEVAVTGFSTGVTFEFEERLSLPITPV
jgi:hypothetical protein